MKRLYFIFLAYETTILLYILYASRMSLWILLCIRVDTLLLLHIFINLFYYVLKMFLFCFCLVSLHGD